LTVPTTNGSENTAAEEQDTAAAPDAPPVGASEEKRAAAGSAPEKPKQRHSGYAIDRNIGGIVNCETGLPTIESVSHIIQGRRDDYRWRAGRTLTALDKAYYDGYVAACDLLLHLLGTDD
jgi:hypothetical protein